MPNTYVIEVGDRTAGIVVPDMHGFRFYSALRRFRSLDGHHFHNPRDAERAARKLIARPTGGTNPRLGETSRFGETS
jgi:hypothetical protein